MCARRSTITSSASGAVLFALYPNNALTAHLVSDAALVERSVSDTLRDLLRESVSLWSICRCSSASTGGWRRLCCSGSASRVADDEFQSAAASLHQFAAESGAEMLDVAQEAISSQRVVKAFGMEAYESGRFARRRANRCAISCARCGFTFSRRSYLKRSGIVAVAGTAGLRATQHLSWGR